AERLQLPVRTALQLLLLQQVEIVSLERLTMEEAERLAEAEASEMSGMGARLRALVGQLPGRRRQVVMLRYGVGDGVERTQREVARLLDLSLTTIEEADRRARLRLRRWLEAAPLTTQYEVA